MGRGRAKAKQTKVARKLKYSGGHTDLDRLRRELGVDDPEPGAPQNGTPRDDDRDGRYGDEQGGDDQGEDEQGGDERYEAQYVPSGGAGRERDGEPGS